MLSKWSVENFKSVSGRVDLTLRPLTIFAGANSSGKSTIIQSILLTKQTFKDSPSNRALALNGPILKLGRFDDVKHIQTTDDFISFGCVMDFYTWVPIPDPDNFANYLRYYYGRARDKFRTISFDCRFDVIGSSELAQLQPTLKSTEIAARERRETPITEFSGGLSPPPTYSIAAKDIQRYLVIERSPDEAPTTQPVELADEEISRFEAKDLYRVVKVDDATQMEASEEHFNAQIVGAQAHHFLPQRLVISYNERQSLAHKVADALCTLRVGPSTSHTNLNDLPVSNEILKYILNHLKSSGIEVREQLALFDNDDSDEARPLSKAIDVVRETLYGRPAIRSSLRSPIRSSLRSTGPVQMARAVLQDIQNIIAEKLENTYGTHVVTEGTSSRTILELLRYFDMFFTQLTRYLGPLRDEPKPLYPLEALSNPSDVGYRGEHTAAVFELNKYRRITYIPPSAISAGKIPSATSVATLHDATVDWLSYLGVADDIRTSDKGKFGHEIQVVTDGVSKSHDLTNVGVGVSQVLPIVVMALLSEKNSLLIFEQPELHLHPRVQSRLGDFFLSLSLQGKQCIVETHSEYLIHRIRRRTAEIEKPMISELVQIYFVERSHGVSDYHAVSLSEFGAILDWPDDFFDQSDRETEQILRAAAMKRKKQNQKQQS